MPEPLTQRSLARALVLSVAWISSGGCQTEPAAKPADDPACADQPGVTYENWGQGFFLTYCLACHSSTTADRDGAPVGLDFDSLEGVRQHRDLIASAVLERESMPAGGGVLEDDLALLAVLLECGL